MGDCLDADAEYWLKKGVRCQDGGTEDLSYILSILLILSENGEDDEF
jgi:hypothetical protein